MIIYKDIFTKDELFTDVYKITLVNDALYKVEGKHVTETNDINESVFGGNKSAEDSGVDDAEVSSASGCNIVLANNLVSIPPPPSKKAYQLYLKNNYLKRLKEHLQTENKTERLAVLEKNLPMALKTEVFEDFKKKKFDFYVGKDSDAEESMQALLTYREEDDVPYMLFFKDGLIEEKV